MATTSRNGPGRPSGRSRAVARPSARQSARSGQRPARTSRLEQPDEATTQASEAPGLRPRLVRGVGITRRAIAFMVVLAILVLSYASSLRVYLRQERDLATAQQQIADRQAENARLTTEVNRWKDPAYVRAQARQRLGWVVPGETGYRVIDANGQPLAGGVSISDTSALPAGEHPTQWWERLAGSLSTSDEPLVQPSATPTVVSQSPMPSSTPSRKR